MKRDSVVTDLKEYHLEVVDRAVRLVLSTTKEFDNDDHFETEVEAVLSGDFDTFFDQATSMLFCDGGCETKTRMSRSRRSWLYGFGREVKSKTAAFFGTLPDIIAHQLSKHNDYKASTYQTPIEKRQSQPRFPFTLPLEVASVVSDLVEFVQKGDGSAVVAQDLDALNGMLRWENVTGRRCFYKWRDLVRTRPSLRGFAAITQLTLLVYLQIDRVYIVARKSARSRPPINLPPPDISWTPPYDWSADKHNIDEDSTSEASQDSDGDEVKKEDLAQNSEDELALVKREDGETDEEEGEDDS